MIKAVIFDFDYTLGDSTNGIAASINYALEQLGYTAKSVDEIRKTVGLTLKETYYKLMSNRNEAEAGQFEKLFKIKADDVMVDNTQLYSDVIPVLQKLKEEKYQICIVTTKLGYRIEQILNKFGIRNLVDVIVGADNVKIEKPSPEGLLWVIEHLKLEKDEVIYVGDSLVDAKTAENADVKFCGVLTGTTTIQDFEKFNHVFIGNTVTDVYNFLHE